MPVSEPHTYAGSTGGLITMFRFASFYTCSLKKIRCGSGCWAKNYLFICHYLMTAPVPSTLKLWSSVISDWKNRKNHKFQIWRLLIMKFWTPHHQDNLIKTCDHADGFRCRAHRYWLRSSAIDEIGIRARPRLKIPDSRPRGLASHDFEPSCKPLYMHTGWVIIGIIRDIFEELGQHCFKNNPNSNTRTPLNFTKRCHRFEPSCGSLI